jgi:type VI secretion system Hcp family effector
MKQYAFSLLIALAALSFSHPTAFQSYVSFKGKTQGQLKGQTAGKGGREKDGWFELQSFNFGTTNVATAAGKGGGSGKEGHSSVVITREVDQASPLLLNAHATNETLESVIIQTIDGNKVTKTVTLTNAIISEIKKNGTLESLSLNFEKMESKN